MTVIRGVVVLPSSRSTRDIAALRIEVRDVTEHDAPASVVATTTLADVPRGSGPTEVPFELEADLRPDRDYAVRATADVEGEGTGTRAVGDLVTTDRVPVSAERTAPRWTLTEVTS